jgi:hypothetical protein
MKSPLSTTKSLQQKKKKSVFGKFILNKNNLPNVKFKYLRKYIFFVFIVVYLRFILPKFDFICGNFLKKCINMFFPSGTF